MILKWGDEGSAQLCPRTGKKPTEFNSKLDSKRASVHCWVSDFPKSIIKRKIQQVSDTMPHYHLNVCHNKLEQSVSALRPEMVSYPLIIFQTYCSTVLVTCGNNKDRGSLNGMVKGSTVADCSIFKWWVVHLHQEDASYANSRENL